MEFGAEIVPDLSEPLGFHAKPARFVGSGGPTSLCGINPAVFEFPVVSLYMDSFYKARHTMNTGLVLCGGPLDMSILAQIRRLAEPDLQHSVIASNDGPTRQVISLSDFEKIEAEVFALENDHLLIETTQNQFLYAASSKPETAIISGKVQLYLDIEVEVGAFSVAIEDPSSGTFTTTETISTPGRHTQLLPIAPDELPVPFRIIISNFQAKPARSRFKIFEVALIPATTSAVEAVQLYGGTRRFFNLADFQKQEAEAVVFQNDHLFVETNENQFLYAAWSKRIVDSIWGVLELSVDADLEQGAFSLSILNERKQRMVANVKITQLGRHTYTFPIPTLNLRFPFRIVLSNYQPESGKSRIKIFAISVWARCAHMSLASRFELTARALIGAAWSVVMRIILPVLIFGVILGLVSGESITNRPSLRRPTRL
jgi:hypothetical protein